MYEYSYGAIGEAVRAKIAAYKQSVRSGEKTSDSFGDVLKSYLTKTDKDKKIVSATGGGSSVPSISGSTLLYALQNSESDTTASSVLSALGFTSSDTTGSQLKLAADNLISSAKKLIELNVSDVVNAEAVEDFVTDFNKVMTLLNCETSSSAYLYKNGLSAVISAVSDELSASGITSDNGVLSYSGKTDSSLPEIFISNIASTASMISSYAGTATSEPDNSYNGVSEYYSSLMNTMI